MRPPSDVIKHYYDVHKTSEFRSQGCLVLVRNGSRNRLILRLRQVNNKDAITNGFRDFSLNFEQVNAH